MLGLKQFKSYEECLDYVDKYDSFNSIVKISLIFGTTAAKEYFAVDRFQSLFIEEYSISDIESVFYDEKFELLKIEYQLLPSKHRRYPISCTTQISKEQILKVKDFNIPIIQKIFEAIRMEILNSLIEGNYNK